MPIRVLIADDNPTAREQLAQLIGSTPDMQTVGQATNGSQAVQMAKGLHPDVIVMDALIPHMDAIEAIREIMDINPVPIVVVCTAAASREANVALEAVQAGALAVLQKPGAPQLADYQATSRELVNSVRAMSGVHVIRHSRSGHTPTLDISKIAASAGSDSKSKPQLVAIVASTGGPQTLSEIVKHLSPTFNLPIVIVQHITADFVPPLVSWLSTISRIPVEVARSGDYPAPGHIYFAPARTHLRLTSNHQFELSEVPNNMPHMPSGDIFLESVARHYGAKAVGIVLTGMGNDGAHGLRAMYDAGAITVAQDADSCVVFGMPQEAIALGAARQTLNPTEISKLLLQYTY